MTPPACPPPAPARTDDELAALEARVSRCAARSPGTARTLRQAVARERLAATRVDVPCYPDPDAPAALHGGGPSLEGAAGASPKDHQP